MKKEFSMSQCDGLSTVADLAMQGGICFALTTEWAFLLLNGKSFETIQTQGMIWKQRGDTEQFPPCMASRVRCPRTPDDNATGGFCREGTVLVPPPSRCLDDLAEEALERIRTPSLGACLRRGDGRRGGVIRHSRLGVERPRGPCYNATSRRE